MRNARSRVERLEQAEWAKAPIEVIFTGKMLARGEKPGPCCFTFVLDDPRFDGAAPTRLEDEPRGVRP
jgi:hypothetical protein